MPNELMEQKGAELLPEKEDGGEALGAMIQAVLSPVVEAMAAFMKNNTEALERIAAAQKIQADRMEALEKQIRLNTPISKQQEKYLSDAIRTRARELLFKRGIEDEKAARKLGTAVRRSVLARYGISTMREIPKHEYSVAMSQITLWNDAMCVRDAVKEARKRNGTEKEALEGTEPGAVRDGLAADECARDQRGQRDVRKAME